jgi:hypothetical protein
LTKTRGQIAVLQWLREHPGFWSCSDIQPPDYPCAPGAIGRACRALLTVDLLYRRSVLRKGRKYWEYTADGN